MADDKATVCSMCGDIGFPEKLFQCTRCVFRFQHTYCSNFYMDSSNMSQMCDWCVSEEKRSVQHTPPSKKHSARTGGQMAQITAKGSSEHESGIRNKSSGSSSKHARRYKLLKDVLC